MKIQKYTEYKDSGISFLGEIPNHWEAVRLKEITNPLTGYPFKSSNYSDKGIKLARGINVKEGVFNWKETKYWSNPEPFLNKYYLKENDILIQMDGSKVGKNFCKVKEEDLPILLLQRVTRLRVKNELSPNYLYYTLASKSFLYWVTITKTDPMVPHIAPKDINNYVIPFPSNEEQTQIAEYLDTKTTIIDKKIKLLQQKIKHFKAYRKTLINETVTKGLDKTVKLKDSGIDWIGEVPEHWEVKRFKEICYKNHTGGTPSTSNTEMFRGENVWVTIADIKKDKLVSDSKLKLTDEAVLSNNIPLTPKGSLMYSFKLTLGKIAFAKEDIYTNEAIISILPNRLIELNYHYYMLPIYLLFNATENIYGAKMLNQKLIGNALLLNPPKKEQQQIADYLDAKTKTIDSIVKNIEIQIITIKELRKTLINDVVTGKVKVVSTTLNHQSA